MSKNEGEKNKFQHWYILYLAAGAGGESQEPEVDHHVAGRKLSFPEEDDQPPLAFLTSHNSLDDLLGELTCRADSCMQSTPFPPVVIFLFLFFISLSSWRISFLFLFLFCIHYSTFYHWPHFLISVPVTFTVFLPLSSSSFYVFWCLFVIFSIFTCCCFAAYCFNIPSSWTVP